MFTLSELRNLISDFQRTILNCIWSYNNDHDQGISRIVLHGKLGKTEVLNALKELGGSIVYETQDSYYLTLLGFLLSDEGNGKEELLVKYAEYLKQRYMKNPEIKNITDSDVINNTSLSTNDVIQLGELLKLSSFLHGSYSYRRDKWSFSIPSNIDDYPEIDDIRKYVLEKIVQNYEKELPVNEYERTQYRWTEEEENSDFWFIEDKQLRKQLQNDWVENSKMY